MFCYFYSDIPEEVASLRDFSTENIVNGAAKCLHLINDEIQVSSVVPASMSARFRLGTTLASACQVCLTPLEQSFQAP